MHPDTLLSIQLGATIGRDKYTRDPAPVIAELRRLAGVRQDILDREVGVWIGYYDQPETRPLVVALLEAFPGAVQWIKSGQDRRGPTHGTYEKRD